MLSYKDFTKRFGTNLLDEEFQTFLQSIFPDLTKYDMLESDYLTSENCGIELGFSNNEAIYDDDDKVVFEKGNPVFSHFILFPLSFKVIDHLPFEAKFDDNRTEILKKAGIPGETKEGFLDILSKTFLVDNYKSEDIIITFDYDAVKQTINFIQIRENNLADHLRL